MRMTTKQELIDGLNQDLAHEYQAVIAYTVYAAEVAGPFRPALRDFFLAEAADELKHAQVLADKISALGGVPTAEPAPVAGATTPRAMLEAVLAAETETIERYTRRMAQAEEAGELALVAQLHDMIVDETHHKEEVAKLLEGFPE
ncbi:bacterioferritin [Oceanithermus desulfurans]|nr:bacterioferritin [Oceanithermus desulfurans]